MGKPNHTKDTFRSIVPEDMTKLQQVIEMLHRGSAYRACQIVDSLSEATARSVGDALIGLGAPEASREYAESLRTKTIALVSKLRSTEATLHDRLRERIEYHGSAPNGILLDAQLMDDADKELERLLAIERRALTMLRDEIDTCAEDDARWILYGSKRPVHNHG